MRATKQRLRNLLSEPQPQTPPKPVSPVEAYIANGRVPFSEGYSAYHQDVLSTTLADEAVMEKFRRGLPLAAGYGERLDERVVEYPWVLSRLDQGATHL